MKRFIFKLLPITGMLVAWGSAQATVSCSITATPLINITFDPPTALQATGTVSGQCMYTATTEGNLPTVIYIGIDAGVRTPTRSMLRTGGNLLTYEINKSTGNVGIWNEAAGVSALNTSGGLIFTMPSGVKNVQQPFTYTYFLNIPVQTSAPVGTYNDTTINARVRQTNAAGTILGTSTFNLTASIASFCRFSTAAPTLNINYSSFSAAAASGTSVFALNCNVGTSITNVTISPATGTTNRGLNYSMAVSPTSGAGTATPQNFTVTGTAAAGQAGCTSTCATATPLANSHTITVFY